MGNRSPELKRADLLSTIGAGVLGAGLALLLANDLRSYAVPLLAIGLVSHAWGMYMKHRLELRAGAPPMRWAEWLYWGCWIALVLMALWIAVRAA